MKKLKHMSLIHSDAINAKNLAIIGMYATDILYVVNVESENHQLQSQQQMCQLWWRPSILY